MVKLKRKEIILKLLGQSNMKLRIRGMSGMGEVLIELHYHIHFVQFMLFMSITGLRKN